MDAILEAIPNVRAALIFSEIMRLFWYTRRNEGRHPAWDALYDSDQWLPPTTEMLVTIATNTRILCKSIIQNAHCRSKSFSGNLLTVERLTGLDDDDEPFDELHCELKPIWLPSGSSWISLDDAAVVNYCQTFVDQIKASVKEVDDAVAAVQARHEANPDLGVSYETLDGFIDKVLAQQALQWLLRQLKLDAGPEDMETLCDD